MEKFRRITLKSENISVSDSGIKISDLIKIVETSELSKKIFKDLNIDSIKDEFINIKGSQALVKIQQEFARKFHKVDLQSKLDNVSFFL